MNQATERITEGLLKAIRAESDGYHFYTMAAGSIQDEKGKEVFATLAQEELEHRRFLEAQYRSFLQTGQADENVGLGAPADLSAENPIFSAAIKNRLSDAHFEMSALSLGIQIELASEQFYRVESQAASDPRVRDFYNELADWESGHYHALLRQQEALKEDYWAAGGFAPF